MPFPMSYMQDGVNVCSVHVCHSWDMILPQPLRTGALMHLVFGSETG